MRDEIFKKIKELSSNHTNLPIKIDSLASMMQMKRAELVSYLVDLALAGYISFNKDHVTLHNEMPAS